MHLQVLSLALLGAVSMVSGAVVPEPKGAGLVSRLETKSEAKLENRATCPSVWTDVTNDLKSIFNGCNDDARAAIRTSFHDCFPSACDGSLILANECSSRPENQQMISICNTLGSKASQYNVSTADIIQAGAALGIVACNGPKISFLVGRLDSKIAAPTNQLPAATANAAAQVAAFATRGFSAAELVALVGAHSAGKTLGGVALDSTVSTFDNKFYSDTLDKNSPASLPSDLFLSNTTGTKETWSSYGSSSSGFKDAFVPAMEKMSLIGNVAALMTDCSSLIS